MFFFAMEFAASLLCYTPTEDGGRILARVLYLFKFCIIELLLLIIVKINWIVVG